MKRRDFILTMVKEYSYTYMSAAYQWEYWSCGIRDDRIADATFVLLGPMPKTPTIEDLGDVDYEFSTPYGVGSI